MTLRDSIHDQALLNARPDRYLTNMHAAYLQLVGGAMMRALGGLAALSRDREGVLRLRAILDELPVGPEAATQIDELRCCYRRAYGSSSNNGIGAMSREFNRFVTEGEMPLSTEEVLTEHLTAVWMSMIDEFARVTTGASGAAWQVAGGRSGCLLIWLVSLSAMALGVFLLASEGP